ncbi:lytic transglycosylase domain-containing protein [Streptomyces sp. NPDC007355]|uniref:lytic transglycosylase domain-containing protein n=1 Tax=Streptomyces sp. NPDC007355 TaxID=3364778 RepID=UPI0036935495
MAALLGRRLRRGATSSAVVAAAVAVLAASQAPGVAPPRADNASRERSIGTRDATTPPDGSATGDSPHYTDLPPLNTPNKPGTSIDLPIVTGPAAAGIPASVLSAYKRAEQSIRSTDPGCNLPWQLLAGIGKVESGQASGGRVDANGTTLTSILGPALNGVGFANISDTDGGAYDGDKLHDRAVGPMQFIPSTWATWGQDANSDGKKDPNNIYDAAQATGLYLCAGGRNLALKADLDRAVLSYNRSREYLNTVLSWFEFYQRGTHQVPDGTGVLPADHSNGPTGRNLSPSKPTTPVPAKTPTPKPNPSTPPPANPTKPATPKPNPPEPTTPAPTKPTTPKPSPPPPARLPAERVAKLADSGTGTLEAIAGTAFAARPTVLALDASGRPVSKLTVRFEIVGATDSHFAGGATTVTVTTGAQGKVVSPVVRAGEQAGAFTVRASVAGRKLAAVDFAATVTARRADTLLSDSRELSATTGTDFADRILVTATLDGAPATSVDLNAAVLTSGTDGPQPATKGPYFKDANGDPVRKLNGLKTNEKGLLTLPCLFADGEAGTFVLRLTTPGGGTTDVFLKVTDPQPEFTPSPTESTDTSPSPSASPAS